MTFDEQLQRVLETFAGRLNEDVTRQVRAVVDELTAVARTEAVPDATESPIGRLAAGVRAISGGRSLTEVLDMLLDRAALDAARVGVLLVRGDRFQGWRFVGFDHSNDPGSIDLAADDPGVIGDAARTNDVVFCASGHDGSAPAFARLHESRGCLAVPIAITGQVVAVLYADMGGTANPEPGTLNPEPVEILTLCASQRLEVLTVTKAARWLTADDSANFLEAKAQ